MADTDARFVLGVDLDGVVADFYAGLRPVAAEWLGVSVDSLPLEVTYGLAEWKIDASEYDNLHRFAVTQRNLFSALQPIEGAPAALRRLSRRDVRIRIITHRLYIKYFHEDAVSQTTRWLEYHGLPYWDLCFMRDKAAVGADLYIEDSPTNIEQLRSDGHDTIVFSNSTNRHLAPPRGESWIDIEKMVEEYQDRWRTGNRRRLAGR
jgi:5'(3')-deoxyribonucleotidase